MTASKARKDRPVTQPIEDARFLTIGLDTGDRTTHACVLDQGREVVHRCKFQTARKALASALEPFRGARVVLEVDGVRMTHVVDAVTGWGGARHPRAHFGIGRGAIESLTVEWPGGARQSVEIAPDFDGRLTVQEAG